MDAGLLGPTLPRVVREQAAQAQGLAAKSLYHLHTTNMGPGCKLVATWCASNQLRAWSDYVQLINASRPVQVQARGLADQGLRVVRRRTAVLPQTQVITRHCARRFHLAVVLFCAPQLNLRGMEIQVRRLQLALVDKFRGRNKMIGGSQFRVSTANKKGPSRDRGEVDSTFNVV